MNKLKLNILYQSLYRLLTLVTPLVTSPYISRVLGATSLGEYSFSLSVINYFIIFAMLGTEMYGTRTISKIKVLNNQNELNRIFSGIFSLQIISSSLAIICYLIFLTNLSSSGVNLASIQTIWLFSTFLDINWFFFGIEEVKYTVLRNLIIKILGIILIFTIVKGPNALIIYALIMGGTTFFSQIVLWYNIPKYVRFHLVPFKDIKEHFKKNLALFVPLVGSSIYWTMDKTLLGILSNFTNTGYYYNADKVMNIPLSLIVGLGMVMLPRMSSIVAAGDIESWTNLMRKTTEFYICVSSAIGGGIAAISFEFVPLFFGKGYEPCILLIICFAPILVLKAVNDLLKNQCFIPLGKEHKYSIAVFVGAFVNLIVNLIAIPLWGALGALIGTGIAEMVVILIEYYLIKFEIEFQKFIKLQDFIYIIISLLMYIVVRLVSNFIISTIFIKLLIEMLVGISVFSMLSFLYWKFNKESVFYQLVNKRRTN